nr:hypothetical protein [uncultured Ruminococcus sp.]
MIITENLTIGEKSFTKKYSDKNVYIENESGQQYVEAIDLVDYPHTYTETDVPIDDPDLSPESSSDLTVDDTLAMLNELGVDVNDQS